GNSYGPIDEVGWLADMVNGDYMNPGQVLCPSSEARFMQNVLLERLNERAQRSFSEQERDELVQRGFNTNYTLSWYMGYSEMKQPLNAAIGSPKNINSVVGPMQARQLAAVPIERVPLMGDARN